MTRSERRLLRTTTAVGLILTLVVVILDLTDSLGWAERPAYDWRAEHFQYFTPSPTDKLVHIDIDDPSLESIGRWPWPRAKLAEVIDELRIAGCKAVALDVIFSEPEEIQYVKPDDLSAPAPTTQPSSPGMVLTKPVDNDAIFAAALRRFGGAVVPVSLTLASRQVVPPLFNDIESILLSNPEAGREQVIQALVAAGHGSAESASAITEGFAPAQREVMLQLVEKQMAKGHNSLADLRKIILPHTPENVISSVQLTALKSAFTRYESLSVLREFARSPGPPFPKLVSTNDEQATVSILGKSAHSTGYVDYIALADGKVRMVPLWANHRGYAFPQVSLALACAYLDVDIHKVQVSPTTITLPLKDGKRINIPVHSHTTARGNSLGMFFDIPWFGKTGINQWQTMYDYPNHLRTVDHTPIAFVWEASSIQQKIKRTNLEILDAMSFLTVLLKGEDAAPAIIAKLRARDLDKPDALVADVDALLKSDDLAFYKDVKPEDARNPTERELFLKIVNIPPQLKQLRQEVAKLGQTLETRRAEIKTLLNGKAALIGWTAVGALADQVPTPLHPRCPGVVVHGVIFNAIVTADFWRTAPQWFTLLFIIFMGLLTTLFVARLPGWVSVVATAALAMAYLLVNCLFFFDKENLIVGLASPLGACMLVWAGCTLTRYLQETVERARVKARLGTYVDPALMRYVLDHEHPVLTGEEKELSIVFTDLAGFTTITERLKEQAVQIIKEYMGKMIPVVHQHNGYLNKLLGDGIMFIFNAPEDLSSHAADATRAVLQMQAILPDFNHWLASQELPPVAVRAGIASGPAIIGNIGATGYNDYTAIGDNVNLASRLEGANKPFGTKILLNSRAHELASAQFLMRPIGKIQVKGKQEWVMTYEPLAPKDQATPQDHRLAELTTEIVDCFSTSRFKECLQAIDRMEKELGESKLTHLYREYAEEYQKNGPPPDFQGQIALTEK